MDAFCTPKLNQMWFGWLSQKNGLGVQKIKSLKHPSAPWPNVFQRFKVSGKQVAHLDGTCHRPSTSFIQLMICCWFFRQHDPSTIMFLFNPLHWGHLSVNRQAQNQSHHRGSCQQTLALCRFGSQESFLHLASTSRKGPWPVQKFGIGLEKTWRA